MLKTATCSAAGVLLLLACVTVTWASDVVLEIDPASIVSTALDPDAEGESEVETTDVPSTAVQVQVSDLRDESDLERTTIGQVSLGQIEVTPPMPELVGAIVSAKASAILLDPGPDGEPVIVQCGLQRFSIETPATLLYWDIESRVEIVLRVGEQDREVMASAKARTWVYPSKSLLEKVTREALLDMAEQLDPVLRELLRAPPPEETEPGVVEPGAEPLPEP